MKLNQSSLLLLLLPALSSAATPSGSNSKPSSHPSLLSSNIDARFVDADSLASSNAVKGSLDVPFDGKDGRPHAGPWVETSAERDRKSSKGDDIDLVTTKFDTKVPSAGHITEDGKMVPHNGGVMDDPNRTGPKEGTRGMEGGVSEKGKENQYAEKVPGSPKEALPLPHSETQKLSSDSDSASGSGSRAAEAAGSLGMLEVGTSLSLLDDFRDMRTRVLICASRNRPIFPTNPTIFPTPSLLPRPRTILWRSNTVPAAQPHTQALRELTTKGLWLLRKAMDFTPWSSLSP